MEHRIQNEASKNKVTYMSGKPKKDTVDDFIYLDLQIYELVDCVGTDEAIKYLQDKIQTIKKMQGGGK